MQIFDKSFALNAFEAQTQLKNTKGHKKNFKQTLHKFKLDRSGFLPNTRWKLNNGEKHRYFQLYSNGAMNNNGKKKNLSRIVFAQESADYDVSILYFYIRFMRFKKPDYL